MTIKRLQIPEGAPIWGPTKPHTVAIKLWRERHGDIASLQPGDYDVTPEPAKSNYPNTQQLTVMEDGTGLYRMFTLGRAAITKMNTNGPGSVEQLTEGRGVVTHIPQDTPGRLILGTRLERKNSGILFLFDVILWSPDNDNVSHELDAVTSMDLNSELVSIGLTSKF